MLFVSVCSSGNVFVYKRKIYSNMHMNVVVCFWYDGRGVRVTMSFVVDVECFTIYTKCFRSLLYILFCISRLELKLLDFCISWTRRVEMFSLSSNAHTHTYKHSAPYFELRNLISGIGYNVFLIAQNAKGRSNSTIRQVFTLINPEKQTDTSSLLASTPSLASLKTFLPFVLFGCAGAIALTAIIVVVVIRKRASHSTNSTNDVLGDQSTGGGNSDRCETASYALSTQRTLQSSQEDSRDLCGDSNESMEKNPDIIPQGKNVPSSCFFFGFVFSFRF